MTLDDRRRLAGLTVAELARRCPGIGYDRCWRALVGSRLEPTELRRIEAVIAAAERERIVAV